MKLFTPQQVRELYSCVAALFTQVIRRIRTRLNIGPKLLYSSPPEWVLIRQLGHYRWHFREGKPGLRLLHTASLASYLKQLYQNIYDTILETSSAIISIKRKMMQKQALIIRDIIDLQIKSEETLEGLNKEIEKLTNG